MAWFNHKLHNIEFIFDKALIKFINILEKGGEEEVDNTPDVEFSLEEIKQHNGKGEDKSIWLAVCGKVFDVTAGEKFYGPG